MSLEALLESSPSLQRPLHGAQRAAQSEAGVLILGEAGTGRSSLARALHDASGRAAGPLVEVDAAGIPTTLFESELFGYESGAFTGAADSRPGRVAGAAGGSLLLDHVEEIPLGAQPKLLRLLSEGRYAPLGGGEVEASVRFLAVGADDLPERVATGAFREDLFYRLEVVTFRLPPLRERRQDVPLLIDFFLRDLAERAGRPELRLADSARDWMIEHSWPGNLREMRNVLERAVVMTTDGELDPVVRATSEARPRALVDLERDEIVKALAFTRGHQGKAAALLGISRKTLWDKRKRYGIP
jgi:DNA-binding NtrC family response regulator